MEENIKEIRKLLTTSSKEFVNKLVSNTYMNELELKILDYKLNGYTNVKIQFELHISEASLNRYWRKILNKLYNAI